MQPEMTVPDKVGLVAGWGNFPIRVAQRLIDNGTQVYCVGITGHADPLLREICTDYKDFGMGRMGAQVRYLKRHGVTQATLAGKIFKTLLFQKWAIVKKP